MCDMLSNFFVLFNSGDLKGIESDHGDYNSQIIPSTDVLNNNCHILFKQSLTTAIWAADFSR